MTSRLPARPLLHWAVRIISFSALTICLWLYGRKLSGDISSIAGCGGEGGCSNVMGGAWSEWFHIPVTLLAAGIHGSILLLTLPAVQRSLGRTGEQLLAAAGVILAGAAVYFLTILYGVEHKHCPWCLGLHLAGLTVAGMILLDALRMQRSGQRGVIEAALLTGFMALCLLAAGQVWGPKPQTFLITQGGIKPGGDTPPAPVAGSPSRELSFFDGALKYDPASLPIVGNSSAKIVLVEYFDYTCGSCRDLNGDLQELKKKWPGMFAVIVLPAPLNRSCNPWLKQSVEDHPGACELAKLALAVWRAKPAAFAEFHDFLFSLPLPVTLEHIAEAKNRADKLAGAEAMATAMEDAWVSQRLQENFGTFAKLTSQSIAMPKLLLHSSIMMHGTARNTEEFIRAMEQQFGLSGKGLPASSPIK